MKLLLNDQLAPITSTIGVIHAERDTVVKAFLDWQRPIGAPLGITFEQSRISGSLNDVLRRLLPLTNVTRQRYLFIPTTVPWTAFFDNGIHGTDAFSVLSYVSLKLKCQSCHIQAVPESESPRPRGGRYGAISLTMYEPHQTHFLNYGRTISLINDGGRWKFNQNGNPFPFENLESYRAKRIRDRFTFDLLDHYLRQLGLPLFDEEFYLSSGSEGAILIEKMGPRPTSLQEFTLAEARAKF